MYILSGWCIIQYLKPVPTDRNRRYHSGIAAYPLPAASPGTTSLHMVVQEKEKKQEQVSKTRAEHRIPSACRHRYIKC